MQEVSLIQFTGGIGERLSLNLGGYFSISFPSLLVTFVEYQYTMLWFLKYLHTRMLTNP